MACPYCINKQGDFKAPPEMDWKDWAEGLSRIKTRKDLPITFQGGEPTIYQGFYSLVQELACRYKFLDLLTNGTFNLNEFTHFIHPGVFRRPAPYASIRFSYHGQQGKAFLGLLDKLITLQTAKYSVGLWGLSNQKGLEKVKRACTYWELDFRVKEYLDAEHGTYKYPGALNKPNHRVMCKPSEFLAAPDGQLYRCHADLYAGRDSYGHILDEEIKFPDWLACDNCGSCNPCDIKLKTNRLQEYGHCSVEIRQ